ncbi:MAG: NAD(P)-dependent glycerol-3-phosphate dehydrogenase [Bacilli bacterium]|nr:NAD(P)-dependent glycerol-3-phosphate dehydrogenase [Bacilli bacterium]
MKVAIIGSGTWGTALALVLADNRQDVIVYGRNIDQVNDINNNHKNAHFFGEDILLPESIKATNDLDEAIKDRDIIILSIPTASYREVLTNITNKLEKKVFFINTAKGFDTEKNIRISELIRELVPEEKRYPIVSLIGPSHAEEVVKRDLTCICAVSQDTEIALLIAELFSNEYFRVYANNDEVGSEIGVAMKNAIALASGVLEGLGYGDNARAALCTRGLAEIVRFGKYFGGKSHTYLGLTGLGDLVVTCYSFHSRNFMAGLEIGKEDGVANFLKNNTKTVEGIRTVKVIYDLAKANKIELPIINTLYEVIYNGKKPSEVVPLLMLRPIKMERE